MAAIPKWLMQSYTNPETNRNCADVQILLGLTVHTSCFCLSLLTRHRRPEVLTVAYWLIMYLAVDVFPAVNEPITRIHGFIVQKVFHTSMLPPTRASKGGSGLSFSLLSCRRECLRPPTQARAPSDLSAAQTQPERGIAPSFSFHFSFTFRPLLKVFVLVLGPHGVLRLIV